jgi:hypothetical protein
MSGHSYIIYHGSGGSIIFVNFTFKWGLVDLYVEFKTFSCLSIIVWRILGACNFLCTLFNVSFQVL